MVLRIKMVAAGLLCISTVVQSMEIKNWDYKERDRGYIECLLPKQNNPKKYAYFLPEKDNSESNRSFSDELLVVKKLQPILSKDVADQILYKAYLTEKTLLPVYMKDLKEVFNVTRNDFLYFPMKNKRALQYIMENRGGENLRWCYFAGQLEIEGRDKEFAQKMSQYILDLPLPIRKELAQKTHGGYIFCNTKYEPSLYNTLLGEDIERCYENKRHFSKMAKIATAGTLCLGSIGILANADLSKNSEDLALGVIWGTSASMLSSIINQSVNPNIFAQQEAKSFITVATGAGATAAVGARLFLKEADPKIITACATVGTGLVAGAVITECAGLYVHDTVEKLFEEDLDECTRRLGFETIPLLKDDEK